MSKPMDENFGEVHGGEFLDMTLDLTGAAWLGCRFINCRLTCNQTPGGTWVEGCHLSGCEQIGDGWAKPWLDVDLNSGQLTHHEQAGPAAPEQGT